MLISAWAATNFGNDGNTRREALDFAEAVIPAVRIEIDALEQDIIMTNAKLGRLPLQYGGGDGALKSWGAFIQPHSLAPGLHEATSYYGVDLDCFPIGIGDCDGIPDIELVQSTSFEVIDD